MTSITTFHLSRVIGKKVFDVNNKFIGVVKDLLVDPNHSFGRPIVNGIKIKYVNLMAFYSFQYFRIEKNNGKIKVICNQLVELPTDSIKIGYFFAKRYCYFFTHYKD
jgi:magnesium transporter